MGVIERVKRTALRYIPVYFDGRNGVSKWRCFGFIQERFMGGEPDR